MRILARIAYDGSKYLGFQRLNNGKGIQNEIEEVLSEIAGEEVMVHGSGRTDAGVHAIDQCVHFDFSLDISLEKLKYIIHRNLSAGIVVKSLEEVSSDFHARRGVLKKRYEYVLLLKKKNPFLSNYALTVYQNLDIDKMKECSLLFLGHHDFRNFVSGTRENYETEIYDISFKVSDDFLKISFTGRAFYRYMVRHLVGALLDVGMGKVNLDEVKLAIEKPLEKRGFAVVSAQGLYLINVQY